MREDLILIGGGGHCHSCIDVIEEQSKFNIAGIVDIKEKLGRKILGYTVIACDEELNNLVKDFKYFLITLGFIKNPQTRIELFTTVVNFGGKFPVILSPYSFISKHSIIGDGTIIMHNAQVNANARIGSNCIINSGALVEHDALIGDHAHISTGAIVNGGSVVGNASFIGSGAVIVNNTIVPERSFIKANQLFIK
jgi:sugar O-acyltransferase (sialic acid O-acetyltransferase NeuD family)